MNTQLTPCGLPTSSNMPWADWSDDRVAVTDIHALAFEHRGDEGLILNVRDGEGGVQTAGRLTPSAIKQFGRLVGFPPDFILEKINPELAAAVINDRVRQQKPNNWAFAINEDSGHAEVSGIVPGWRCSPRNKDIAQTAWMAVIDTIGGNGLEIVQSTCRGGSMKLVVDTPREEIITPKVGDILKARVVVEHTALQELNVYTQAFRLFCANGASAPEETWEWSRPKETTPELQLQFVRDGVMASLHRFEEIADRSRAMAATRVEGDAKSALYARLRAMGVPARYWSEVLAAFEEEPGDTEWHMLNAITRFATHSPELTATQSARFQSGAGSWMAGFEIVTSRLPRPLANRIGAQIIE